MLLVVRGTMRYWGSEDCLDITASDEPSVQVLKIYWTSGLDGGRDESTDI